MSFHKFNSFTGTLRQSSQLQSLAPLTPRPLQKTNLPKMMYDSMKTKPVRTNPPSQSYSTVSPRIQKLQKEMQADLSKPVYLIRGTKDVLLYRLTALLLVINIGCSIMNSMKLKKKFK